MMRRAARELGLLCLVAAAAGCVERDRPMLLSARFADLLPAGERGRMVSVGRFALRGVSNATELFTRAGGPAGAGARHLARRAPPRPRRTGGGRDGRGAARRGGRGGGSLRADDRG